MPDRKHDRITLEDQTRYLAAKVSAAAFAKRNIDKVRGFEFQP